MNKPKIYVETSTISVLTARPSENLIMRAKQMQTKDWWALREQFDLFISETVAEEMERGDPVAAALRLDAVVGIPYLEYNDTVEEIAQAILRAGAIPSHVEEDAIHVAFAAAHEMNLLVTWNQKHIAAPAKQFLIREIILSFGLRVPQLLTPEDHLLMLEGD